MTDTLSRKEESRLIVTQVFHPKLQEEINELELEGVLGSLRDLTI